MGDRHPRSHSGCPPGGFTRVADGNKGHRQRLKERFLAADPQALTEEALLELLLTYAIPQKDVQPLAQQLIAAFGSLGAVLAAEEAALRATDGVGEHAAILLRLVGRIASPSSGEGDAAEPVPDRSAEASGLARAPLQAPPKPVDPADAPILDVAIPAPPALPDPPPALHAPAGQPQRSPIAPVEATQRPREAGPEGRSATTRWRASGPYNANNASKAGLLEETRIALQAYDRLRDRATTRQELLDGGLPQRSRETRETILRVIGDRLAAWHPPDWACQDLLRAAGSAHQDDLPLLLLLHTARQDLLLYRVVRQVIAPRWREGIVGITRVDVQRFLDEALPAHPEVDGWSTTTREKLAGNLLTILRDYGLLLGARGLATKRIVEPVVTPRAAGHLGRLLREEGIAEHDIDRHPDWDLWLLPPTRARVLLEQARTGGDTE